MELTLTVRDLQAAASHTFSFHKEEAEENAVFKRRMAIMTGQVFLAPTTGRVCREKTYTLVPGVYCGFAIRF